MPRKRDEISSKIRAASCFFAEFIFAKGIDIPTGFAYFISKRRKAF